LADAATMETKRCSVLIAKTFFVAGTRAEGEEDFIATVMMGYDK